MCHVTTVIPFMMEQEAPLKRRPVSAKVHSAVSQKSFYLQRRDIITISLRFLEKP
jgi:hypothetical protein